MTGPSSWSLAGRYPVQARPRLPPLPGQQQSGKKKKGKAGVKGAKGGKLAPGAVGSRNRGSGFVFY